MRECSVVCFNDRGASAGPCESVRACARARAERRAPADSTSCGTLFAERPLKLKTLIDSANRFFTLDLPRTLDRLWGNFPSYDAIGRLEAPMDFMNSVGVLLPMELWGRCVLYSCLNASHFTWASANDKNQF
jgi:hypothetical protein